MENSKIEWTDHTFNIVHGCTKVSPACQNCYAEALSNRMGRNLWGPNSERLVMSESYWKQPLAWNRKAEKEGKRAKVFCSSMADVFEDHPTVEGARQRLWHLITETPCLDWLLLTKRPENIKTILPVSWDAGRRWPNVWLGTTVESQSWAEKRIPELLKIPAKVLFLSCEPLLGPIDFSEIKIACGSRPLYCACSADDCPHPKINWIICGGESGHGARPMASQWAREIKDQCQEYGVPFFFKQWGNWLPCSQARSGEQLRYIGQLVEKPIAKKIHRWQNGTDSVWMDKHFAGRLLDGVEYSQFPQIS